MAKIVLEHVTKLFDPDVVAVNDLSLDIADGEFIVLVGPSGCGKTTVLRLLAGREEGTAGEITDWVKQNYTSSDAGGTTVYDLTAPK